MTGSSKSNWKRHAITASKFAISFGAIAWILRKIPFDSIAGHLVHADPVYLVLALAFNFASVWLLATRWKVLLADPEVRVRELLGWSLVGIGAGLFLPSSAASDGLKALLYGRSSRNLGRSLLSTAIGRIFGIVAIAVHMVVGIALWPAARTLLSPAQCAWSALALLALVALVLAAYPRVRAFFLTGATGDSPWLDRARRGILYVDEVRGDLPRLGYALALSIFAQSLAFLGVWSLFEAIHASIAIGPLLALLPLVILGSLAPISLGGIGVREGVMIGLFTYFHIATAEGCLATSLLGYLILGLLGASGAIWWLVRKRVSG